MNTFRPSGREATWQKSPSSSSTSIPSLSCLSMESTLTLMVLFSTARWWLEGWLFLFLTFTSASWVRCASHGPVSSYWLSSTTLTLQAQFPSTLALSARGFKTRKTVWFVMIWEGSTIGIRQKFKILTKCWIIFSKSGNLSLSNCSTTGSPRSLGPTTKMSSKYHYW